VVAAVAAGIAVFVNRSPQSRLTAAAPSSSTDGEYVQRLADCVACHSVADGAPLAASPHPPHLRRAYGQPRNEKKIWHRLYRAGGRQISRGLRLT
jgi:hypothetical protein